MTNKPYAPEISGTDKTSNKDENKAYEYALQLACYEGQISWQMNILFVALNVGIGTILQGSLNDLLSNWVLILFMSIIGFLINFLWLGTFHRNNKYYAFRMAQARNAEPNNYQLVDQRGYDFTQGKSITFTEKSGEEKTYKLEQLELFTTNKKAVLWSIYSFFTAFALLLGALLYTALK